MNKLFSGRYFLTLCAGIVFIYGSVTGKIQSDVVGTIVAMVFTLYFTRNRNGGKDVGKTN